MTKSKEAKLIETGFGGFAVDIPVFSTGEAAEILGVEIWRLQKFVDVESYRISPSGQLGRGRGSRRTFYPVDIYRLATASRLVRDGFAPKHVAKVLEHLDDEDLSGEMSEQGAITRCGIYFTRGKTGPAVHFFPSGKPPKITESGPEYYILDLDLLADEIDQRIKVVLEKRKKR